MGKAGSYVGAGAGAVCAAAASDDAVVLLLYGKLQSAAHCALPAERADKKHPARAGSRAVSGGLKRETSALGSVDGRSVLFQKRNASARNGLTWAHLHGVSGRRRAYAALSGRHLRLGRSGRSGTGAYHAAGDLGQHRAIASLRFAGSFPPILRFEKFEIHTVFLHFPNLDLTKNLSPNLLAELCGAALDKNRIHRRWMRFCVIRKAPAHEEACRIARLRVLFAAPREALTNSSPDSSRSAPLSAEPRADARL